jgi:hypothetical protein
VLNKELIRVILLVTGSLCLGAWAVNQVNRRTPTANSLNRTVATSRAETTANEHLAVPQNTPHVSATQTVAPIPQPTVKRAELVLKKDTVAPKALPAFVRIKEPVIFPADPSNRSPNTALPIGTKVRVIRINGSWIWIEKSGNSTFVPVAATDFEERMAGTVKGDP